MGKKEMEQLKQAEERKRAEKEKKKAIDDAKKAEREQQMKVNPMEMFKDPKKYSKYDEKGIPTHDVKGEELSKSQIKKLQKVYADQEKKYKKYLESLESGVGNLKIN